MPVGFAAELATFFFFSCKSSFHRHRHRTCRRTFHFADPHANSWTEVARGVGRCRPLPLARLSTRGAGIMRSRSRSAATAPQRPMRIDLSDSAYFDLSGQMTLHFKHERTVGRWATCNLVFFPVVTLDAEAKLETRLSKSPPTQSTRRRTLFRENTMAFQKTKARSNLLAVMRSGELRRFVQTGVGDLTRMWSHFGHS